jgi:LacI family transcriptional regulator
MVTVQTGEPTAEQIAAPRALETPPREVTLRDVAEAAGVHPSTASRALDPSTTRYVNAATAQRIQEVAASLGYQPNPLARGLRTRRSYSVGLLLSDPATPRMLDMLQAMESELVRLGYTVLLAASDGDPETEGRKLTALAARHVDGLVLAGARHDQPLPVLRQLTMPIVTLSRPTLGYDAPSVLVDEAAGISQVLEHLVTLGHRNIGYVSPPTGRGQAADRLAAFTNLLIHHGLDPRSCPTVKCDGVSERDGHLATRSLLGTHSITALVVGGDLLALGSLKAAHEAGADCPADLSIVGYHDQPLNDYLRPALTSVRVPFATMGADAARLLLELIATPGTPPRSVLADPELVVRASTGPAPTA